MPKLKNIYFHPGLAAQEILSANKKELDYNGRQPTYQFLHSYDHLIDKASMQVVSYGSGGLDESLVVIKDYIRKYHKQVCRLANHLQASTKDQTLFNIWHWCKTNIIYDFDAPGKEQLRTPARTWADTSSGNGVDCDDYSIFIASILLCLNIPFQLKIVAFNRKPNYSHIYVVVPSGTSSKIWTMDGVMNSYDEEPPGVTKSFLVDSSQLSGLSFGIRPYVGFSLGDSNPGSQELVTSLKSELAIVEQIQHKTEAQLRDMHKLQVILSIIGVGEDESAGLLLQLSPYIEDIFPTGQIIYKDELINDLITGEISYDELTAEEKLQAKPVWDILTSGGDLSDDEYNALSGYFNYLSDDLNNTLNGVGLDGKLLKRFRKKRAAKLTKKAAKAKPGSNKYKRLTTKAKIKTAKATGDKKALQAAKKERRQRIKSNAKKIGKVLAKLSPAMAIIRGLFLSAVKINLLGMATGIAKAIEENKYQKVKKIFEGFGGKWSRLKRIAEMSSHKKPLFKKKSKLQGLGAAPLAAAGAAAAAIIGPIMAALKPIMAELKKKTPPPAGAEKTTEEWIQAGQTAAKTLPDPTAIAHKNSDGTYTTTDEAGNTFTVDESGNIVESGMPLAVKAGVPFLILVAGGVYLYSKPKSKKKAA